MDNSHLELVDARTALLVAQESLAWYRRNYPPTSRFRRIKEPQAMRRVGQCLDQLWGVQHRLGLG